jgi:hypothetical protein
MLRPIWRRYPTTPGRRPSRPPLLVHFRLANKEHATNQEDDVSAELQAWFEDRRIEAADLADLERWSERVLGAQTLAEVLGDPS